MRKSALLGLAGAVMLGCLTASATADTFQAGALTLEDPFSRETPKGARVGAGYLTIRNDGDVADRLVAVECACAEISEIHEMKMDGGVMRMQALSGGLDIPAGESVALKPGGIHLMFIELKAPFVADEPVKATLIFEKAGPVEATFDVAPLRRRGQMRHSGHSKGG